CLVSLLENTDYGNCESIIVDNASTDGTRDFLKTFNGTINVIANNNNLGFAKACNQGAKIATGKYLVFLNNDTTLHPGWLTEMIKLVETDERIAIVGNKQIYPTQNPTLGGMIWHAGVVINENRVSQCIYNGYDQNHPLVNKTREFPAVAGSCMLVRKDVFEKLNGFDEIYLNSHEDIDFCLRVREAGYKVMYCPTSVIEHHVSASEGRHDNESRNAEIFRKRWAKRLEQDDLKYYEEDAKEFLASYKFRNPPSSGNATTDMPSIGFLSTYNQKCGLATYAQQLLVHYDPSKVLIFAEHGKDILPEPDPINLIRCWTRYSPDYHFVAELARKQNMPLIHINNQRGLLSEPLVDFMRHLYQDGRRTVITFHSTVRFNMAERECFKFIDKAIVHTPENKVELIANGCDEKKIVVIPHGVPEAKLVDRYTARQKLNLSALGGSNIIASFGFVQESKGIHEIIEAVARLKANGVSVKYFILGTYHPHNPDSKTYLEKCKALALRLGVANLVVFKDEYLSDDTVLQYLQASDAIIMNYKSNTYESSGATAFAISTCRPLITSNAPMFATFGDACLHVCDANPLELAIYNVLSNPFLRNYLQKNALKFIEENNWQRIAEKHFFLYAEVMSKPIQTSINLFERYNSHPDNIYDEDFQRERIDWLKSKAEGRILEVGCATGFVSKHVGAFAAMDIDEGRLGVSNRLRKSCRFIKADATKGMPFKDKSFDTVILAEVL
ncbi:MAG TPA: glycosyltransferase, partial [Candidatus Brocadiales bacterium]|nr:glycosyltransferase [Candidatus Brocadiales bacterium]